jgi:hypothetical protein
MQQSNRRKQETVKQLAVQKKKIRKEQVHAMLELAKRLIGKKCIISTLNFETSGIIREVVDGGILLEKKNTTEVINPDYIMRIRAVPEK